MASARAFGIFNEKSQANENQSVGKNIQSLKGSKPRSSSACALKDLTNNRKTQRTIVHQDGKGKANKAREKEMKPTMSSILQKIGLNNEKAAPRKPSHNSYDVFSPQDAEYAWGQASCLPDDLLEQMIDFNGVSCNTPRKPLPAVRPDLLDLPDLYDDPSTKDEFWPLKEQRSVKPLDLPDDYFPLVEINSMEFML